jgi:hypothetical protein
MRALSRLGILVAVSVCVGWDARAGGAKPPSPAEPVSPIPLENLKLVGQGCDGAEFAAVDSGLEIQFLSFELDREARVTCLLALDLPAVAGRKWVMDPGASSVRFQNSRLDSQFSGELFFTGQKGERLDLSLPQGVGILSLGGSELGCAKAGIARGNLAIRGSDVADGGNLRIDEMFWSLKLVDCESQSEI